MSPPDRPRRLSLPWRAWIWFLAFIPCFGTVLLLAFPFWRLKRIWRLRGYAQADQEALWAQLNRNRWWAFGTNLGVWALSFLVPLALGVLLQIVEKIR